MKSLFKFLRILVIAIIIILLLLCVLYALLQTKWGKEQIRKKIVSSFNEVGISITAESLTGAPPFSWVLKSLDLKWGEENELKLSQIKLRLAIFPLLRGKIAINYLKVENAEYIFSSKPSTGSSFSLRETKALLGEQLKGITIPYPITIHHFAIDTLTLSDRSNATLSFGLTGKLMLDTGKNRFAADVHLLSPDHKMTYLELELAGSESRNFIESRIKLHLPSLPHSLAAQIDAKVVANLNLKGPWKTWKEILYDLPNTSTPLEGNVKVILADTHLPQAPYLDRKWKLRADFSIPTGEQIYVKEFILGSDLVQLQGKGHFSTSPQDTQAVCAFALPDLSLAGYPPLSLSGKVEGKALYQSGNFKISFETQDLAANGFFGGTTKGMIKGAQRSKDWEGEVKFASENAQIPFENSFAFEYLPDQQFSISDFSLKIPEGNASGSFSYNISHHLWDSELFANVKNIERFAPFFKEENIDGNFAIELQCSSKNYEQDIKCTLLGENMRFQELLLDNLTLSVEVESLFEEPLGRVNILAEKFYAPNIYLSRLNFGTSSDEESWPFFLDVEGRMEHPLQCYAKGFWRKDHQLLTVETTQFFGELALVPFSLKFPFEVEWGADYLNVSPLNLRIGEGSLYSTLELSPVRSIAQWELKHFPLEIFSCLKPRFVLKGYTSAQGFVDADPQNIEGSCHLVLEEANVLHYGKKKPFQARGSLQANLNQNRVQLHSDIHAIDEQLFDLTASLPVDYQLYPFRVNLNETYPSSAEVIAEGKLEDLFDFVNLGMNQFTGLVSCRLFLSQTLANPALQGNLEWQNGTFENYFAGIALKDINAEFQAKNDVLQLTHLKASDEKSGNITAEGKIFLKPKEHFPYAFEAEMSNLHALGFDMIDCNLSGPFYLHGDTLNMYAQGNLIVDEAMIQITERLPYEAPSLPVTYINRPPHLYTKTVAMGPKFSFHMDIDLSAEDKVYVQGRGLKAELQGNVRLHGANTSILTTGSLKLLRGEYQFAGKTFKLSEGEVLFTDKPTPSAYLSLNGTLSLPDITITAMLRGPLAAPQLSFQSNPQRPTSELLSLILFNKDITEISHTEAIQLASTLVSLSGGAGPDVLDSIRKSIGIDRLNIASRKKSGESGSDEVAVEIGKYLTRGILVTLSQSPTSSQVIVEVELPKGFVFQAESQEEQEGKFSLKWTKSY